MKRTFTAAFAYLILGLVAGVFYREYTKYAEFTGETQLSTLHTHLLSLGVLVMLIVVALDAIFDLSGPPRGAGQAGGGTKPGAGQAGGGISTFALFFWIYNAGLIVTITTMTIRGILQVHGHDGYPFPALSGIAGLGHILLAIGLVTLFICLGGAVKRFEAARTAKRNASAD